jgi:hypothetical protein
MEEKTMVNKKFWFGMLVMVLAFGITVINCTGKASALVGRWVHESGVTYDKPENMELLKNGTGICDGFSIAWKVEGNRLIIQSSLIGLACDYKISGAKLTLTYDDGGSAIFAKK